MKRLLIGFVLFLCFGFASQAAVQTYVPATPAAATKSPCFVHVGNHVFNAASIASIEVIDQPADNGVLIKSGAYSAVRIQAGRTSYDITTKEPRAERERIIQQINTTCR